jgi:hypothetical protein
VGAKLRRVALTENYTDVERLIHHTVHSFVKRFGGDYDELRSDANTLFMEADESYTEDKGSYSNHIRYRVWMGLLEDMRKRIARQNRLPRKGVDLRLYVAPFARPQFDQAEVEKRLSEDARAVLRLVLDSPIDVEASLTQHGNIRTGGSWRRALREFLRDVGWSMSRVTESFNELKENL